MGVADTFWWALGYGTAADGGAAAVGRMPPTLAPAPTPVATEAHAAVSPPPPLGVPPPVESALKPGLAIAVMGGTFVGMSALFWPFLAPVIRRHVLPFIPATDMQVSFRTTILRGCTC